MNISRNKNKQIKHTTSVFALAALAAAGTLTSSQASTINTSNPTDIATFQTGATIEFFDTGLLGLQITSYSSVLVPAGSQFSSRDLTDPNVPAFNSGGATFANPASNPGTPVGVFDPEPGIAGDVASNPNVIGPLIVGTTDAFGSGFLEVIFRNPVSKVGFQVTHGDLSLFIKDINNQNFSG